ncbi:putative bifunctional diguanylate cyclase/phosphodiesterase [Roseibium sediminicola]|uniref:EAL domain-containing protein n=1 Tax=Roseibium sediminicola TaxID=2933272 RepID=A0ABT0GU41_9HYPH|nr:GGDEF domain-containing phosphodiesterase [Roseibium sp. CAU 1639]MCK7612806.1 EAL domain-containing protein [Roseibium sp. CAU 1639]
MVGSSAIWAAHLVALGARVSAVNESFQLLTALLALAVAFAGVLAGFSLSTRRNIRLAPEFGGVLFGLTVAAMGAITSAAHERAGLAGSFSTVSLWSLLLSACLGAIALSFVPQLRSRRATVSATLFLFLSVLTLHLSTAMPDDAAGHFSRQPNAGLLSEGQMIAIALTIFGLTTAFAASGVRLEKHKKESARRAYQHLSLQDSLTHLPNRHYVQKVAADLLKSADHERKACAVVLISLDQFKAINDLHGYEVGDTVLCSMAETLKYNLNDKVLICRFYGDEFLVINPALDSIDEAVEFARLVRSLARRPIQWRSYRLSIRSSIGLAVFPRDGSDLTKLVQRANLAAKQAKSIGGNLIQPYVTGMEESNRWEASLASDLRNAALENQLSLVFQKQNLARTGDLIGYEALVRWRHAEKGPIAPEDFIPIAERSGIILDIGNWVLEAACVEAATWAEPLTLAVNASPLQFSRSDFAGLVSTVLIKTGLPADRLEIELTESTPIEDHERVHETIQSLHKMGVRVAMDDFGKGYSSLNTLQAFPFDKIKVDRAFTQSLETNPHARAILRSAILLGHSFGIPVIAEGVETDRQLQFLQEAGCLQVQGFLFGKHLLPSQIKKNQAGLQQTGS